jgi:hypothetical protein
MPILFHNNFMLIMENTALLYHKTKEIIKFIFNIVLFHLLFSISPSPFLQKQGDNFTPHYQTTILH